MNNAIYFKISEEQDRLMINIWADQKLAQGGSYQFKLNRSGRNGNSQSKQSGKFTASSNASKDILLVNNSTSITPQDNWRAELMVEYDDGTKEHQHQSS